MIVFFGCWEDLKANVLALFRTMTTNMGMDGPVLTFPVLKLSKKKNRAYRRPLSSLMFIKTTFPNSLYDRPISPMD